MTRLQFDRTEGAAVYDADQVTEAWQRVGLGQPSVVMGLRHAAHEFTGDAGYEGQDPDSVHTGGRALLVQALIRPNFDVLAGSTVTILARGQGGPTVPQGWGYDVRLTISSDALIGAVELAWTDETLTEVIYELGQFHRPPQGNWTLVSLNREAVGHRVRMRTHINGAPTGDIEIVGQVPATPAAVLTLGCRRNHDLHEQFFVGDIEFVEIKGDATGNAAEYCFADRVLDLPDRALDTVHDYWFSAPSVARLRDSVYESYRLRPLAAVLAQTMSDIQLREHTSLPNAAYGARLTEWEHALGLTGGDRLFLTERQTRAVGAAARVEGISVEDIRAHVRRVLGLPDIA